MPGMAFAMALLRASVLFGIPQCGQLFAEELISFAQSTHFSNAMYPSNSLASPTNDISGGQQQAKPDVGHSPDGRAARHGAGAHGFRAHAHGCG